MSRLLRTAMISAVALFGAGALASAAQAVVVDSDNLTIATPGYDFGGYDWAAGVPIGSGDLHYHWDDSKIRPHLTGTIHLNDADGTCGRMRMKYYDYDGTLLETEYGGEVCVDHDSHAAWSVDLDPYADRNIHHVTVSVQKETVSGWSTMESETEYVNTHSDNVKITADGVDLGLYDLAFGEPTSPATMTWSLSDEGVKPSLLGDVMLNNSSGVCARVNLKYMTDAGYVLTEEAGHEYCAPDNDLHRYGFTLGSIRSDKLDKVKVQLQTLAANGTWQTAGWETVSIED
jgi:hypothetical protein